MLGKLMKHEFRATGRILLPVMGAMLILAGLANLCLRSMVNGMTEIRILRILMVLIVTFSVIAVIATVVMALVMMVSRFYRNLLKDEGYLMFTLPVSTHALIWSKIIVSLVWFLITGLLIWLLMGLTALNISGSNLQAILEEFPSWSEIRQLIDEYQLRAPLNRLIFQFCLAVLLGGIVGCLHFYAAMSLGHMFSSGKILLSIVFYVAISFVFSMVSSVYGYHFTVSADSFNPETAREVMDLMSGFLWPLLGFNVLQAALLYLATFLGLKKGLNLA